MRQRSLPLDDSFDRFWARYPHKVGKLDAIKAYAKARTLASAEELLAGVEQYIRHKPDYADWAHPSSWLNKGRWMDDYGGRSGTTLRPEDLLPPKP